MRALTGWELFWFALGSYLLISGVLRIFDWVWMRLGDRIANPDESPRIHVETHGGCSVGNKPAIVWNNHDDVVEAINRIVTRMDATKVKTQYASVALYYDELIINPMIIQCALPLPKQINVPWWTDDGLGRLEFHRTDECIPDGDHLAVVFR